MSDILVENFDVDVLASGSTYALSNDVGSLSSAFVRKISSTDKATGRTDSTGNLNPVDAHCGIELTGTSTLSFFKGNANPQKQVGEVWRYVGSSGASDEFISRGSYAITLSGASSTQSVTGLVDRNRCVPILNGINSSGGSVNDYDSNTVGVVINSSGDIVVSRQATTGTITAYVTVIEFTGSNWTVAHGVSSSHDSSTEVVQLNSDSTGAGGSSVDVVDWSNAMIIEASMEGDTSETGIADVLGLVSPGTNTSSVTFSVVQADTGARNDGTAYIHVIANTGIIVSRQVDTNFSETNGTTGTTAFPSGVDSSSPLDELSLEWFSSTSGTGTAHARGRILGRISAANTIEHWVHRSGNNVRLHYGVVDLSRLIGALLPAITIAPSQLSNGAQDVVITGINFGAVQGAGRVELWSDSLGSSRVAQSIDSWSDSSIQFDFSAGSILEGTRFFVVVTDGGIESAPRGFTYGLLSYTDIIQGLNPDHWWQLNNDSYVDSGSVGTSPMTSATQNGGGSFEVDPICEVNTHSWLADDAAAREAPDSLVINLSAETERTMGGWIRVNQVSQPLTCIYKEGGSVNNICFFLGMGNVCIAQLGDTGDDNVQVFSDIKLTPGRAYHIIFRFSYLENPSEFSFYLDGQKQSVSSGNPLTATDLDSHSGDIIWAGLDTAVEVAGTDVTFVNQESCNYAQWASWQVALDEDTGIRDQLFRRGARPDFVITSDTPANMQVQLDGISNTARPDAPLAIRVESPVGQNDLSLNADNVTFSSRCSIEIEWRGSGVLTWVNLNGSNADVSKSVATEGSASLVVVNPAVLSLSGLQDSTEVRVYESGTITEIGGVESTLGGAFSISVQVPSVDIVIHALGFLAQRLNSVDTSSGNVSLPIQQRVDRQYGND